MRVEEGQGCDEGCDEGCDGVGCDGVGCGKHVMGCEGPRRYDVKQGCERAVPMVEQGCERGWV